MQKHLLYINLFTITSALALGACADEVENAVTPDLPEVGEKTPIELSVGGVDGVAQSSGTRASASAVITDGKNKTMHAFAVNTKIFMIMKSERDMATHDGFEYKGDRTSPLYTVTRGDVAAGSSEVVFTNDAQKRFWDDAHARSSQLSIWAYAQMGQTYTTCSFPKITDSSLDIDNVSQGTFQTNNDIEWQSTEIYPAILSWSVGNPGPNQTANTLLGQDLLFSNNIVNYNTDGTDATKDKRLKFDFNTPKHFPKADETWSDGSLKTGMKFYHAMSKITIQLWVGDGYNGNGSDFVLKNSAGKKTIDELVGFNTKGLFNIKDGEFQKIISSEKITEIPLITETLNDNTKPYYILQALVIPNIHEFMASHSSSDLRSRFVDGSTDIMIAFTIDGNTYKITSDMLYDALSGLAVGPLDNQIKKASYDGKNYIPLEAGKNYVFKFQIGKTAINNISATLAKWVDVEANTIPPSNAYVALKLKRDEGDAVTGTPNVALYRAADPTAYTGTDYDKWATYSWETGYSEKATLSETSTAGIYKALDATLSTQWYWPNNTTFYHFRTINKELTPIVVSEGKDYVSIYSGPIQDTYKDSSNPAISSVVGDGEFNDYLWGAPFKNSVTGSTIYSPQYGFCNAANNEDGQIYKAIGATTDNIMLIEHHMMSNIYVDIESVSGTAAVNITPATTTVKIVRHAQEAKIQMGDGLVTEWSNYDTGIGVAMTYDSHAEVVGPPRIPAYDYTYRVVPQALKRSETVTIGIEITTADGNVYKINDLSAMTEKSSSSAITNWLPGKKYYYKFVLAKTGIVEIQATVVDWEDVEADEEEVKIQ